MFNRINSSIPAASMMVVIIMLSVSSVSGQTLLSPSLDSLVQNAAVADSIVNVVIFLNNTNADAAVAAASANPDMSRAERIKSVVGHLMARQSSPSVEEVLRFVNQYTSVQPEQFWITPAVTARIPVSKLHALSLLTGVRSVVPNVTIQETTPVSVQDAPEQASSVSNELNLLRVPILWQQGLNGHGRLVCSFDTGVEESHPALTSKWRGNHASLASTWFSKVKPDTLPYDNAGHGTHTMGIMVGSAGADSFGVAPGAEWISAGVIDQGRPLTTTISDILDAFQWALDPDGDTSTTNDVPDVLLNSWGIPAGLFTPCDPTFWQAIDNVEAAGIVTIFAAGNEGPNPMTIRNPADRTSSPINSFSVGAVDINKIIAGFSSRGPSSCDTTQIKPEVVAPGVSIRSSTKGGTYAFMSGTSMAAPYVAGLVALCRQFNPDATVEQIKYALLQSAVDLGPAGDDNAYGHGLIDASQLTQYLPAPNSPHFAVVGKQISGNGVAFPGDTVQMQVRLINSSGNIEQVHGRLVALTQGQATVLMDTANFYFGLGGTSAVNNDGFSMTVDPSEVNGLLMPMRLYLSNPSLQVSDSVDLSLIVGYPEPGTSVALHTGIIDLSVSDFAQYGLAGGSIYNLAGEGFRVNGGPNLLYESGILVGRNSLQLSGSIRDSLGHFVPSAFTPQTPMESPWIASDGAVHRTCAYADTRSSIPIPVTVNQETVNYSASGDNGFVIFKYYLVNHSLQNLTNLHFGFFTDFDLSAGADQVHFDTSDAILYQQSSSGPLVGLIGLSTISSYKALANGATKTGFKAAEKYSLISTTGIQVDEQ
ncbi:MAG TPA: S8 family serine peptidase, partial [Candidatus Acidoferrum sp.]|nr:S8 family serine peptidase [Candidatus Acidoferrum sp.]